MKRPVLHLICQAHLDPVWLWPERNGIAEILTTMHSAVDRAREYPQFKFTRSSAAVYRWAEKMDPALFRSIQDLVSDGRWEVIGGMIEQPDCNLPSAESFLRQALYAKRYFADKFGEAGDTRIAYVPDSFGHAGGLPQILRHSEMDAYVFMRPQPENGITLPLLFRWKDDSQAEVLGIRIPIQYSQSYAATPDEVEGIVRASVEKGFAPGFENGVMWLGIGNHGGGPTKEHLDRILELQEDDSLPEIRFSTVREFVSAVREEAAYTELPVVDHELQFVFRGCYSATGETKQQHRKSENLLFSAESLSLQAGRSRTEDINEAWWQLGFNQFHDILAGTCVQSAQADIRESFGQITTIARRTADEAAFRIARSVNLEAEEGTFLTVVNPLPWKRMANVSIDTFSAIHGREKIIGLESPDGKVHPVQWNRSDANFGPWGLPWGRLITTLPAPASGHRTFRVLTEIAEDAFENPFAGDDAVSTEQFIKTGDTEGRAAVTVAPWESLRTESGEEVLSGTPQFQIVDDPYGTWGHGVEKFDRVIENLEWDWVEEIEAGKVQRVIRHHAHWNDSEMYLDVVENLISKQTDFRIRFNWQEKRKQLRLELPLTFRVQETVAHCPASIEARPATGAEYPCLDWVAVESAPGEKSIRLEVANDSTYSFCARDSALSLLLARGVPLAEHPPFEYQHTRDLPFLDQGWQERGFSIRGVTSSLNSSDRLRWAKEFQIPAVAILDSAHPGSLNREESQIEVESANVSVLSLGPDESGETVLRVQEMSGKKTETIIRKGKREHRVVLSPWEIASFQWQAEELLRVNGLEKVSASLFYP